MPETLIAFDIDNCLMPVDGPAASATREALQALVDAGAHLCFASGKPCLYLSGLTRGLSLMGTSLIGENGADIWVSSTMPPVRLPVDVSEDEREALARLREEVTRRYGERVFFQPNAVGVTAFPVAGGPTPETIAAECGAGVPASIKVYVHVDSADWAVARFNKGVALTLLAEHLGMSLARVAAVGDSENDLPMFDVAGLSLWVGAPDNLQGRTAEVVDGIGAALQRLIEFAAADEAADQAE